MRTLLETVARALAVERGHQNPEEMIVTIDSGQVPVWQFYLPVARAVVGPVIEACAKVCDHMADTTMEGRTKFTEMRKGKVARGALRGAAKAIRNMPIGGEPCQSVSPAASPTAAEPVPTTDGTENGSASDTGAWSPNSFEGFTSACSD